jgi:hypothetical protein
LAGKTSINLPQARRVAISEFLFGRWSPLSFGRVPAKEAQPTQSQDSQFNVIEIAARVGEAGDGEAAMEVALLETERKLSIGYTVAQR